jgi:hypothetical protein
MKGNTFDKLLIFLNQLEQAGMSYALAHQRDEAVMVTVAVPGERWEVEFLGDGSVEAEPFVSHGEIEGEEALNDLLALYGEPNTNG